MGRGRSVDFTILDKTSTPMGSRMMKSGLVLSIEREKFD